MNLELIGTIYDRKNDITTVHFEDLNNPQSSVYLDLNGNITVNHTNAYDVYNMNKEKLKVIE